MDNILDGITPVNGGLPSHTPTAQAPVAQPTAPVTQTMQTGIDPATLEVATQTAPVQQTPTQSEPTQEAPTQAALPTVEETPPQTPAEDLTFFDPEWKYTTDPDDDPFIVQAGKLMEKAGINGEVVLREMYHNGMSDALYGELTSALGSEHLVDWLHDGLNKVAGEHVKREAGKVYDSIGGEAAWGVLSQWCASADIDPAERRQINAVLSQGGIAAQAVAQQLMTAFNTHATEQEKQSMISIINPAAQPTTTAAPAQPATKPTLVQADLGTPGVSTQQFEPIHSARELADISAKAKTEGKYTPAFEDSLALRLKKSIDAGTYKRIAVKTKAPDTLAHSLRDRY